MLLVDVKDLVLKIGGCSSSLSEGDCFLPEFVSRGRGCDGLRYLGVGLWKGRGVAHQIGGRLLCLLEVEFGELLRASVGLVEKLRCVLGG